MKTGILDAEINGMWQVAHDSGELTSAVTSYDITGLEGDTDIEYQLIVRSVDGANTATGTKITLNNDTTAANYGYQYIKGVNATASAARNTGAIYFVGYTLVTGDTSLSSTHFFAKSGKERTWITTASLVVDGTSIDSIQKIACSWDNTADELTSIQVYADQTNGLGIGSRIILLKKVHNDAMQTGVLTPNKIEGAWERIYSNTLTSTASTISITGLTGNTDQIYKIVHRGVSNAANNDFYFRFNNDSDANYGAQRVSGNGTSVTAVRNTALTRTSLGHCTTSGYLTMCEMLLYAKSGYERTAITTRVTSITGTTVTQIDKWGYSWDNTSSEITSLDLVAQQANGLGIGTSIELYRLNL